MISDSKIKILFEGLKQGKTLTSAAQDADICYSTAMKYKREGRLPSEIHVERGQKKVKLFVDRWERYVAPKLKRNPNIPATKLLRELVEDQPDIYKQNMLRTFQRRVLEWKEKFNLLDGDIYELMSYPGAACVIELLPHRRGLALRSRRVPGALFLFYLPFSKWIYIEPLRERTLTHILQALEDALWKLGFVPRSLLDVDLLNRTSLARTPKAISSGLYSEFCQYYNMRGQKSFINHPENQNIIDRVEKSYNKYFEDEKMITDFKTFSAFRSFTILLSEENNSSINKKTLLEERKFAYKLPGKGFSNWVRSYGQFESEEDK